MYKKERIRVLTECKKHIRRAKSVHGTGFHKHVGLCFAIQSVDGVGVLVTPEILGLSKPKRKMAGTLENFWFPRTEAGSRARIRLVNATIKKLTTPKPKKDVPGTRSKRS